jgi:hypothetical protein
MRKVVAVGLGLLALAFAGFATADVTVSGDNGGTVQLGQTLTVTVSDSYAGSEPGGTNYAACNDNAKAVASGWFSVGPLGPAEGGTRGTLAVSCTPVGQQWNYSGSVTVTVPQDAGSSMWLSVAVQEIVPGEAASTGCSCSYTHNYNFNRTYTVAAASTSTATTTTTATGTTVSVTTSTTTTGTATTAASTNGGDSTTTSPATTPATTTIATVPAPPTSSGPGKIVLLGTRTRTHACRLGVNPDRRCSPGAYYSRLTRRVICSSSFRAGAIRNVPESERHAVETEYGLAPKGYGRTLEIDRIVSLQLGGSNTIANLYPEEASFANGAPGYRAKDRLEKKVRSLVCSGDLSLRMVQRSIARNWRTLYKRVFGAAP